MIKETVISLMAKINVSNEFLKILFVLYFFK